ncbi:MAG TPA: hypothetical protein PK178_12310 [Smithellaceae bacterium]|nr:hypothetical protein [Smithellaceae bacterium]
MIKSGHSREGGNPDVVPAKAGNQFHYSWIPDRASLVRNDESWNHDTT